ncbi:MAG: class I SAM-dependent methyltransferase [Candidatus Omnitrophica bacterium]|nr:class I SAM-dependent methyltransferase [Candidatus Omnitrophota bacterium]
MVFIKLEQLVNAMAGDRPFCRNLRKYYDLSISKKKTYLEDAAGTYLFNGLPEKVANILKNGFFLGLHAEDIKDWDVVSRYFQENSRIIPALRANPGTYTMLEQMYHFKKVSGVVDNYFLKSIAGGQALKCRYEIINKKMKEHVDVILKGQKECFILDIGSGPGRNCVDVCRENPHWNGSVKIECIDIDEEAIFLGEKLVRQHGIKQIVFVKETMTRLRKRYPKNVDYALLIGILCSLTYSEKVKLLKRIRHYFKPGGKLVAAALTVEMARKDLLCSYILRELCGWGLQYPDFGELKKAFEDAGWKYGGFFQEEPTKLYEIVIGIA